MNKKRMFQILDDMNVHDIDHNTKLVTLHPDVVSMNQTKNGVHVTMGVPLGILNIIDHMTSIPDKRLVLMVVGGPEFDKRLADK